MRAYRMPYTTQMVVKIQMKFWELTYSCRPQPATGGLATLSMSLGRMSSTSMRTACMALNLTNREKLGLRTMPTYNAKKAITLPNGMLW
eukprot:CAMPEP_0202900868 /NCGR_PEP_ID=MMETSP1392-20130828/12079_1 /ASSEMBLY_ACC=CAM_ASM_000868 /TAXON_ID=225041 /ORGANISM="Chlamydomonas chlamydogama, Strain SAG 11-48b" /LENGTH=88 /DNA_ID=CAMNT_0049587323 /DNA_START=977 /DNA_END=1243 /DNA_ORIENTATION=+